MKGVVGKYAVWFLFAMMLGGVGIASAAQTVQENQSMRVLLPGKIVWKQNLKSMPAGVQYTMVMGNPSNPGVFGMRLKFPKNYQLPAHYHLFSENVTVISGKISFGYGDKVDKSKSKLITPGGFLSIPARVHHFVWTGDEGAVIQLNNMGPWEIIYVNPAMDPRKSK